MPAAVHKIFDAVKESNPSWTDQHAWAVAWSQYCRSHKSQHCHRKPSEYGATVNTTKTAGLIRTTYEIVTPESAEEGDADERGWIDEDGEEYSVKEAAEFLIGTEPSSSFFHSGIWYTHYGYDTDFETGGEESRSYHLTKFSPEDEKLIYESVQKGRWVGPNEDAVEAFVVEATLNLDAVRKWMTAHLADHLDDVGEVNSTSLAEEAADVFDAYEDRRDYRPVEELFDLAAELAIQHDRKAYFVASLLGMARRLLANLQVGQPVEVQKVWAASSPAPLKAWFRGYEYAGERSPGVAMVRDVETDVVLNFPEQDVRPVAQKSAAGGKLFADTVIRRDAKGKLWLMNHKDKGWASWAMPVKSVEDCEKRYECNVGAWSKDQYSEFAPVTSPLGIIDLTAKLAASCVPSSATHVVGMDQDVSNPTKKKRLTPAQSKALKAYNFALQQEDRYLGSVFVNKAGQDRVEAATRAAYEACKALGMGPEHGL